MSYMQIKMATFFLIGIALGSCGDSNNKPSTDFTESRREVSQTVAQMARSSYALLAEHASALNNSATAFVAEPGIQKLKSLREKLHNCRMSWQSAAPYHFGPAEDYLLRSSLNTYPADQDKINSNISTGQYTLGSPGNIGSEGFAAIGYLVYGVNKTDQEIVDSFLDDPSGNRVDYLLALTERITLLSGNVYDAWKSGGSYGDSFDADDMLGTDVGSALSLTVNAFELHLQRYVRDGKVGIPAGVRSAGVPRPTATEAYYEGRSVEYLLASLNALKSIYTGDPVSDKQSLKAYLVVLGFADLAEEIDLKFEEILAKSELLNDPLSEQITSDNEAVIAVFLELQQLVPMIKSDMASAMGVIITNQDADGD